MGDGNQKDVRPDKKDASDNDNSKEAGDKLVQEAYKQVDRNSGKANDYKTDSFENPYQYIGKATDLTARHGIDFAVKEFEKAIDAADRIDQKSVETDRLANLEILKRLDREIKSKDGVFGQQGHVDQLKEQQQAAARLEQFLYPLYLAPAATRIEMAANLLKTGNPDHQIRADKLLEKAFSSRPELKSNAQLQDILTKARQEGISKRVADARTDNPAEGAIDEIEDVKIPSGRRRWKYVQGTGERDAGKDSADLKNTLDGRTPADILREQKEAEALAKEVVKAIEDQQKRDLDRAKESKAYENPEAIDLPAPVPPGTAERLAKNPLAYMIAGYMGWKFYKKGKNWYARRTGKDSVGADHETAKTKEKKESEQKTEKREGEKIEKSSDLKSEGQRARDKIMRDLAEAWRDVHGQKAKAGDGFNPDMATAFELAETNRGSMWSEQERKSFEEMKKGYLAEESRGANERTTIDAVHNFIDNVQSAESATENKGSAGGEKIASTESGTAPEKPVTTSERNQSRDLTLDSVRNTPRIVVESLVGTDGVRESRSIPIDKVTAELIESKFKDIVAKIAEAKMAGKTEVAHELEKLKAEYERHSTVEERRSYCEEVRIRAVEGTKHGSGKGALAKGAGLAAILLLVDAAMGLSAEASPGQIRQRVIPTPR